MDVIKDLTQFSSEPFLKSLSPASTGDIPPSPPRLDDERVEVPMPKSHSLPASPSQHHLSAVSHHNIIPDVPLCFKENNNKEAINFSSSKSPEPISAVVAAAKINPPAETQIRPSSRAAPTSPTSSSRNQSHQQFCLRWNNYQTNLTNVFDELLQSESFVDVTLACEGQSIKAHKMVLSACSPYFQSLFYDNPCQHPIVIMRDVGWSELKAIMEFMYKGEINVSQDQINPLLKVAEMLKIRGLAEVNTTDTADDISAMASATLVADGGIVGVRGEEAATAIRRSPPSPKKPRLHVNTEKLLEVNLSSAGGRKRSRSPSPATIIEHHHQQQHQQQQKEKHKQMQHHEQLQQQQQQQQQQQSQHQYQARQQLPPQECPSPSMSSSSVRNPFASPIPPHSSSSSSQASNNHSSSGNGGGGGGGGGGCGSNSGGGNGTSSGSGGYPIATPPAAESMSLSALGINHVDEMEIKPEIAEMIREEERAKLIEGAHPWMSGAGSSSVADSYQYQLQSMWQKCWNTNQQSLVQQLRFRERGPLKSWRPESMAEAIFSVLKEGLSLSQAARKYDIPYPTFVLYANRVHNMLGPSLDGGTDPRPKARGRPQRILLGMWPEELIRSVIKAVVFRDYREIKEETVQMYANGGGGGAAATAHSSQYGMPGTPSNGSSSNGYHHKLGLPTGSHPSDSPSPLSTMAETLRRQIQMSQQSPSPSLNMYKSPAFLQRSEMEDPMSKRSSSEHHLANAKISDNLPDLSALGLMGIPGLNVIPQGRGQHQLPHQQQQQHHQQNSSYSSRELKESMQQHMSNAMSQAAAVAAASRPQLPYSQQRSGNSNSSSSSQQKPTSNSPFSLSYKSKGDPSPYKFPDKRMLEGLTPGIDFEAIANGLLQKSHKASPRFEDFFPGPDVSELFAANSASEAAAGFPIKDHPIAKIKLEQQHHSSDNHEE